MLNAKEVPVEKLSDLKRPSGMEKKAVSACMKHALGKNMRMCAVIGTVAGITGLLLLVGSAGAGTIEAKTSNLVIACILFLASFFAWKTHAKDKKEIAVFERGMFRVSHGWVTDIDVNTDLPGERNVRFVSVAGETAPGLYRVRYEELEDGTPAILAYMSEEVFPGMGAYTRVFTPYMLSDEGAGKFIL